MGEISCAANPGVLLGLKESGGLILPNGRTRNSTITSTQSAASIVVSDNDRDPTVYRSADGEITNLFPVRNSAAAYAAAGSVLADMGITCRHDDGSPVNGGVTMNRDDAVGIVRGKGAPSK